MTATAATNLLADIGRFEAVAHQWDALNDRVLLIKATPAELKAAPFLDQRILKQGTVGAWVDWREFEGAAAALPSSTPPVIFHVGHCGSTLFSKLIEEATGVEGLREPLVLRGLALEFEDAKAGNSFFDKEVLSGRLRVFLRSIARNAGKSVVKASSMCGGLIPPLFGSDKSARGIFAYIEPEIYIASMLGGENNRIDLKGFAKFRRQRIARSGVDIAPLALLSPGELAGMCWLAEAVSLEEAAPCAEGRLLPVDFDAFLKAPAKGLRAICRHLAVSADENAIEAAVSGPTMKAYSKAQEHNFTASDRAALIARYAAQFQSEIAKGAAFLDSLAKNNAAIASALGRLA